MPTHDAVPALRIDERSRLRRALSRRLAYWTVSIAIALTLAIPCSVAQGKSWLTYKSGPWYAAGTVEWICYSWVFFGCLFAIPLVVRDNNRFVRLIDHRGDLCCPDCGARSTEGVVTSTGRKPVSRLSILQIRVSHERDALLRPLSGERLPRQRVGAALDVQSPVLQEGPVVVEDETGRMFLAKLTWNDPPTRGAGLSAAPDLLRLQDWDRSVQNLNDKKLQKNP